jgi:hypothetical protein
MKAALADVDWGRVQEIRVAGRISFLAPPHTQEAAT